MEFIAQLGNGVATAHVIVAIAFVVALIIAGSARATKAVIVILLLAVVYILLAIVFGQPLDNPQGILDSASNAASNAVDKLPLP